VGDIAYQNKDIASKLFAESLKNKSFRVYGLDIPKIVGILPTNLPAIFANELKIDNLFLLEDDTVAIVDYESKYKEEDKIKYLQYIARVLERYRKDGILDVKLRLIVIYTTDVKRAEVNPLYDAGALTFKIEMAFLSELDSEEIRNRLSKKVREGERLGEEELMEFIVLPLTYPGREAKRQAALDSVQLAMKISGEDIASYVLSGLVVFADKFMDEETSRQVKEWLSMTKVGRLFAEEAEAKIEKIILNMLRNGDSVEKICAITEQTREKVEAVAAKNQIVV